MEFSYFTESFLTQPGPRRQHEKLQWQQTPKLLLNHAIEPLLPKPPEHLQPQRHHPTLPPAEAPQPAREGRLGGRPRNQPAAAQPAVQEQVPGRGWPAIPLPVLQSEEREANKTDHPQEGWLREGCFPEGKTSCKIFECCGWWIYYLLVTILHCVSDRTFLRELRVPSDLDGVSRLVGVGELCHQPLHLRSQQQWLQEGLPKVDHW